MKNFIFLICLFFVGLFGYSQVGWQPEIVKMPYSMETFKNEKTPEKFTGSPYLNDNFLPGTIMDEKGNSQGAFLRYNAVEDIVEIKIDKADKTEIRVLPKIKELTYSVDDHKYVLDSFQTNKGDEIDNYVIEYYKGDAYALYGNPLPKVSIAVIPNTPYGKYKPANLSVQEDFYIKNPDGLLYQIRLKGKDIKKVLPKSKELNNYLAENKLETPQDYAKMLQWFEKSESLNPNL